MFYSLDSMTTRGASGLTLQQHWRMMGALEAADGMYVWYQHSLYFRGDAGVLADAPPSQMMNRPGWRPFSYPLHS